MGCATGNLALFAGKSADDYEPATGCLKDLNLLSKEHNLQLRQALAGLRARRPGVRLIYADFYAPIVDSSRRLPIATGSTAPTAR